MRGNTEICGNSVVKENNDFYTFENILDNDTIYFTWTKSNNMWQYYSYCETSDELLQRAYKESVKDGKRIEAMMNYLQERLKFE